MNTTIIWLILFAFFVILEIATAALTSIWFAFGSLFAIICSGLGMPIYVQIIVFVIVSFVVLFFLRPFAMKYVGKNKLATNAESMIGKKAIVIEAIDNNKELGRVRVDGIEWMARSMSDEMQIPEGQNVVIKRIDGVKLIVD